MATDVKYGANLDLNNLELRNAKAQMLASAPAAIEGKFYYNTTTKQLEYYNGTGWIGAGSTTYGPITSPAVFGQSNANGSAGTAARSDHSHALPAHDAAAHSAIKLSDLAAPTSALAMGSQKITGLANGTAATDAATKGQVDSASSAASAAQTTANAALPKAGGTMSGAIAMGGNKITGLGAATVNGDAVRYEQITPLAPLASPTFTGTVTAPTLSGTALAGGLLSSLSPNMDGTASAGSATVPARQDHRHPTDTSLMPKAGGTFTGPVVMSGGTASINMGGNKIGNMGDGTGATDAVTKQQLDAAVAAAQIGLDVKVSARVGSTGMGIGTYTATAGASGRGQITAAPNTMDGVTLAVGNRILVGSGEKSGIWTVTTVGTGSNGVWDRATDFDSDAEVTANAFVFIEEGNTYADTAWVLTTNNPITIGGSSGTSLTWAQFAGPGAWSAGQGISIFGSAIAVNPGAGLTLDGSLVTIDTAVVPRKYAATLSTSATSYVVTHNLGTRDVQVQVTEVGSPYGTVVTAWEATSANTITVYFATAPSANQYRVSVMG